MTSVSVQKLKSDFARWAALAASGETIQVTRHNRDYVRLTGCRSAAVHWGKRVGTGSLDSVLDGPTKGKWRSMLAADREGAR